MIPCGLVVRIQPSHGCGRGSIPRMGILFFFFPVIIFCTDVYEGAPTTTTALLATVPKIGVFSIFTHVSRLSVQPLKRFFLFFFWQINYQLIVQ